VKKPLAALLVLALAAAPSSAQEKAPKLEGTYDAVGKNPDGKEYKGTVTISKKGDVYKLEWKVGEGTHQGVGFMENGRLCCSWATEAAGGGIATGAVVYKIDKGKLVGKWTQLGLEKVYDETLTRAAD
jgi:hypothetical protein